MKEHFSIAIDGPGGAGKSSLAKAVAKKLSILHVDTGAIYRTIGYAAFARGLNAKDESQIAPLLKTIRIDMAFDEAGRQKMLLDGKDVSREIRLPELRTFRHCRAFARTCLKCSATLRAKGASSWTDATSGRSCCRTRI